MNKLQKQIKHITHEITTTDRFMQQQTVFLSKKISPAKLISLSMLGSFAYGFVLARNKTSTQVLRSLTLSLLSINRFYQAMRKFYFLWRR
jgi:hypothetical protein